MIGSKKLTPNLQKIVIVGRPNVGKSTLFNRLVGARKSIVQEEAGTTRDRVTAFVRWENCGFTLIDTGGLRLGGKREKDFFSEAIDREVFKAMESANLIIFLADGKTGLTAMDEAMAEVVRKIKIPTVLAVNKIDSDIRSLEVGAFYKLGLGDPCPISATHNLGIVDLMDQVLKSLPESKNTAESPQNPTFRLAIVGEPNVGKSTLLNALLEEERAIVSEVPGTTRDSIEEMLELEEHFIQIMDTAGIRHRRKVKDVSSFFSLSRAKRSIREADITFLLFDATKGIQRDTKIIAGLLEKERKPVLLVVNKWDLASGLEQGRYEKDIKERLGFLKYAPFTFISAKNKKNLEKLLRTGLDLWGRCNHHISTRELNNFLSKIKRRRLPSPAIRLKFLTQTTAVPQEFICFVKNKKLIPKNFISFLENELTRTFALQGIPLRLILREEKES